MDIGLIAVIVCFIATLGVVVTLCYVIVKTVRDKHKCRGKETGRRYMPGALERNTSSIKLPGTPNEHDLRLVYGYTEITYKCDTCGIPFVIRITGKVQDAT